MAEEMILKDDTLVEFKDGELTLISNDGESVTFDGFPAKVPAESDKDSEPIQWIQGELPGGVKIRTNKATGKFERI